MSLCSSVSTIGFISYSSENVTKRKKPEEKRITILKIFSHVVERVVTRFSSILKAACGLHAHMLKHPYVERFSSLIFTLLIKLLTKH